MAILALPLVVLVVLPLLGGRGSRPPLAAPPAPDTSVARALGGDARAPLESRPYIFERAKPPVRIQQSSVKLAGAVPANHRLLVQPVESTDGTAAIFLQEQSDRPTWGYLLVPAERRIFRVFADDRDLGEWLIVLVDVFVAGVGRDPVPLTAFRWHRAHVEAYARCGIPEREVDPCTQTFFRTARTVSFAPVARLRRGI